MMTALVAGFLAGLGVAIPVGAAAVLIVDVAVRRGWRAAAAAGTGVAVGDGLFALLAAVFGGLAARLLTPWATALQLLGVVTLVVIAVQAIRAFPGPTQEPMLDRSSTISAARRPRPAPARWGCSRVPRCCIRLRSSTSLRWSWGLHPQAPPPLKMLFAGGAFVALVGLAVGAGCVRAQP